MCGWVALNSAIASAPAGDLSGREHLVPRGDDALGVADRLAVRRRLALDVEVAAAQVDRVDPEQRGAPAEDVLDHQHPLRPAEATERRLRGLVGARDPAVEEDVRDPVGVVDVAERPGEHRLAQVEAPAAVGGEGGLERLQPAVVVEADPPLRVEPVALAGHRHVVGAAEPQPDRPPGERGPESGDRGEAVRLHLLAAEPAAHPQALHGDVVVVQPEHVGDDLLRLGGVLRAALHEDLTALVHERQRCVGLEVEVLLPRHLRRPAEHVGRGREPGLGVAPADDGPAALEAPGLDRLGQRDDRGQRLVVHLHGGGAEPCRLERLRQHPAHRVPDEHHLAREERLVVLDPGVVDPRHVRGGEHADHAVDLERGSGVEAGHPGVGMG